MDKVGSASSSLTEVQHHQCINVVHDIQEKLEKLEPPVSVECCIYKVPDYLRKSKGEHYTPQIISIGPFHQNNPKLETMEHHKNPMFQTMEQRKLRYLKYFRQRADISLEGLVSTIKDCEESVRHFYAESIHLGSDEFVKIIVVDAIFILELFWRYHYNDWTSDDNGATLEPWLTSAIRSDLILLENQLPFFVLEKLFNVALKHDPQYSPLLFQVITFEYFRFYNTQNMAPKRDFKIKHFLDLLRTFWLPDPYQNLPKRSTTAVTHLYTATQLHEAGLVFKPVSSRSCLFDIKFTKGALEMPPLTLDNSSETLYRNLLALEQCHYPNEAYITDYFILLGFLISSSKDVNLLVRKGVMVNLLANKDAAKTLVNNLVTNIIYADMNNVYSEACNGLKAFYDKPWHSWKATLRREYFSTPWRIVSTIAAVILLVLTLLQTGYTMIPQKEC